MNPQRAYLTDPLTLEFEASIVQKRAVKGGQLDLILEKTCFYPIGGGQDHDTGRLGESRIVDVFDFSTCSGAPCPQTGMIGLRTFLTIPLI